MILINHNKKLTKSPKQSRYVITLLEKVCVYCWCAHTTRWKWIIWKLTSEVGSPRMEDLVRARLGPRVFPDVGLNPRPVPFLRCLGTVGRWRRPRCTVSAGSPTMWAGLWSNATSVKTGFTAGTSVIMSSMDVAHGKRQTLVVSQRKATVLWAV